MSRGNRSRALLGALVLTVVAAALVPLGRGQDDSLTLVLGGDVIFDNPIEYALRRTSRSRDEPASYEPLFADLRATIAAADLAVVNLETPVAERRFRSTGDDPPRFAAPTAFLAALAAAGVDAVTLANNHAYDQGVLGLSETMAALDRAHVAHAGAAEGSDGVAARLVEVRGHTFALLAFAEGTNIRAREDEPEAPRVAILDETRVESAVRDARSTADFVLIAFHWTEGREHVPSPRMRRYARLAANAGADMVWGHGTHLPSDTSVLATTDGRSVPVLWSLGNLIAVMESSDEAVHDREASVRDAWLARVTLDTRGDRLEVRSIEAEPFWIGISEREGSPPFVRPLALGPESVALREEDDCARCARLAQSYERRAARARAALALGPAALEDDASAEDEVLAASFERGEADRTEAVEPVVPAVRAPTPDESDEPVAARGSAPTEERSVPVVRSGRAREDVVSRTDLRIAWASERAMEASVDSAQLDALVRQLRADGRLHLTLVVHPSGATDRGLWARRGARARGLVAIRGPSRSRIHVETGSVEPTARLEARLWR